MSNNVHLGRKGNDSFFFEMMILKLAYQNIILSI
jgi:hypothetical protein